MKDKKKTNPLLRLTLPAEAVERLRKSGIYCTPNITVEFQQATKRHVLRGRESGGAIKQFGHYVTFCGEGGERLPWFVRPDSLTSNGDHAIVLAPALVSVEALRVEHTYELLIARHELRAEKEGARPRIWSRLVFRGWQGQLPLDLVVYPLLPGLEFVVVVQIPSPNRNDIFTVIQTNRHPNDLLTVLFPLINNPRLFVRITNLRYCATLLDCDQYFSLITTTR